MSVIIIFIDADQKLWKPHKYSSDLSALFLNLVCRN